MEHCSGGPGPNTFDTLGALNAWLSKDVPPDGIIAANSATGRTMLLCKYPEEASYIVGNVNNASSWACRISDQRMLQVGADGKRGGADVRNDPDEYLNQLIYR
jgi:feruloyl esterase